MEIKVIAVPAHADEGQPSRAPGMLECLRLPVLRDGDVLAVVLG